MDINRISGGNQAPAGLASSVTGRQETPHARAPLPAAAGTALAGATAAQGTRTAAVSEAELKRSVEAINRFLQPANGDIEFSIDEETDRTVIRVIDSETREVLRQIPSEEAMEIAKQLDRLQGLLVKDKA